MFTSLIYIAVTLYFIFNYNASKQLLWQELSESQTERHSKYLELRKREETMEEFLASWEATKEAEAERLAALEAEIVVTLGSIGRRLAALPSPADYLALEQDLACGGRTLDTLTADHAQLALYLNKV